MKLKRYRLYPIPVLTILFLWGCNDFLATEPDSTRASLDTPDQVSQLLATAYPQGSYVAFSEAMSDNAGDKGVGEDDRVNRGSYLFEVVNASVDKEDSPDMYWAMAYKAIAAANLALQICNNSEQPELFSIQKGEALVARAYAHFMLVSFYSKFYNPETASTDIGIPYVTEPEEVVNKQYDRKTVAYVYEMIEKDLLEGLPLIKDYAYSVPKYHFNIAAANAFASRFYLVKGEYAKVVQYANAVFPSGDIGSNLRPWNTEYFSLSPEALYNRYAKASENANLLLTETNSIYGRFVARYRYGLTNAKWNEISAINGLTGTNPAWAFPLYTQGDGNLLIPKLSEYFVKQSVNAEIGAVYVMVPLFTAEEVLFNRAEAYLYLNNTTAALADINMYMSKRLRSYSATTHNVSLTKVRSYYGLSNSTQNNLLGLLYAILDLRRVEFVQEGMRWFDMLRYGIPVEHTTRDGQVITVDADDPRRQLQLPQSVVQSGIAQNER
ncbi:SusD-like starch-binding protein associating with outer membrane [Dyadobacter jejuensis]|uniref:SusD-like starch-binding protein associating with outer membrane n=1 Tax=Dyadobacter jejuensis TaxID=1082580 RepID=A0A316ATD2_9BACT|nr:RagB/SusD family nutrient uptake outer membrane protein [Dyadobacter jejuensis]PWJ60616.1 SusD-like starch-binding protein associating with outer membrane [Dyadobacter jejuensis]